MATDPVERIRTEERQSPFSANLRKRAVGFAQLAHAPGHPYLSVYIDWRPEGESPGVRPGKIKLENRITEQRRALKDAGKDTREFDADVERVTRFLDDGIDPAVHGMFLLACDAHDVFETVQLAIPVDTTAMLGPTPSLRRLVTVIEDYPRFAVLHADQHEASLYVINRATPESTVSLESNDYPRKQQQGGWSQQRFQARQDERVSHFARAVAEETRRQLDDEQVKLLVLSVGEVFGSALQEDLHQTVKDRIVGEIRLDNNASESEIITAALPVVEQAERDREANAILTWQDAVGAGTQGAAGTEDVLLALESGQVMTLLMSDDFEADGWADFGMDLYGAGGIPAEHPAGGELENLVKVDLDEQFIRRALQTSARIKIVPATNAARLHHRGGVGAILRY